LSVANHGTARATGDHGPRRGAAGRAIVKVDEVAKNVVSGRPGALACNVWTTEGFPANNDGDADERLRKVGTTLKDGTIFRVIEFSPGLAARNHRTDSSLSSPVRSTWNWTTRSST
jgi:hypothetical protein